MIPITKPFLPPKEEYEALLSEVWERNWLTNNGQLVQKLEHELKNYLKLDHLLYVSNGTIALQIAMKALGLKGEVITTPFSYVATASSIVWEGYKPIFVDIDPDTLNIDPAKIERAITPKTSAIVATHVFGNPCDVEAIQEIADRYNLKVIYDAAHCFGTKYKSESIFKWGDISTTSFHATKLFQTVEGGAVITEDPELAERMFYMRNFGHDGPGKFNGVGINGKNCELHAAMGLCNLKYIDEILSARRKQCEVYDNLLKGLEVRRPSISPEACANHAYYPIIFKGETVALRAKKTLEKEGISPRRYFYPSLNNLNYVEKCSASVSEDISSRILCLPLYHEMTESEQEKVANVLMGNAYLVK